MMMENSRPEEEIIIKYIRNLFRLKRELNYTAIKEIFLNEKKKLKQLKIKYLEMLRIFLSMKKKIKFLE